MTRVISTLIFAGYAFLAVFGTGTLMAYHWPGYIAIGLAGVLGLGALKRGGARGTGTIALIATLLLVGYISLRAAFSEVGYLAREDLALLGAAFVVYVLYGFRLTTTRARFSFALLILILALGNVAVGLYQYFRDPDFHVLQWIDSYYVRNSPAKRISGFYNLANHLAGFLTLVSLLFLAFVFTGKARVQARLAMLYGILVLLGGIVLSGSRGGALGLLAGLVVCVGGAVWLVSRLHHERLRLFLGLAIGAAVVAVVAGAFLVQGTFQQRGARSSQGEVRLLRIWPAAMQQFLENQIAGTGSRSFSYRYYRYAHPRLSGDPMFAHNEHLQLLADYGALGFVLMLVFVIAHVARGVGFLGAYTAGELPRRKQGWAMSAALTLGALSGVASLYIHAVVEFNFRSPPNALVGAFMLGILVNPGPPPKSESRARAADVMSVSALTPQWLSLLAAAVIGVVLIVCGMNFSRSEWLFEEAKIHASRGKWEKACLALDKAVRIDSKNPNAFLALGEAQFRQLSAVNTPVENTRFVENAVQDLKTAAALHPADRVVRVRLATFLSMLRLFDEAGEHLEAALASAPRSKLVMIARAQHLRLQRRFDEEIEVYKHWLKFRYWSGHAMQGWRKAAINLSAVLSQGGRHSEAVDVLKDFLRRYEKDRHVRSTLQKLTQKVPHGSD